MTTVLTSGPSRLATRGALSITLAVSGLAHAYLYVHGYHQIPTVGTAFMVQGSAFVTLAVLILVGGPRWLQWASGWPHSDRSSRSRCPAPSACSASSSTDGTPLTDR